MQDKACETATPQLLCSAPVTVTINVSNLAPTAVNDSNSVAAGKILTVKAPDVLGDDTDPNSDKLQSVLMVGPAGGTLKLNADGSFTYTANNIKGPVTFTYQACETLTAAKLCGNTATVTITVK